MVPDTASLRSYVPASRPDKPISCLVCSDKSFGNNFGAITCESCKAFFRRTANERDKLACPFNDNCEITIATRKHCRKCRLEKCFSVGMIKEWIQSEEQLKIRRAILKERKLRREMSTSGQITKRFKTNSGGGVGDNGGSNGNSISGSSISGNSNAGSCSSSVGTNNERPVSNWPSIIVSGQNLDGPRVNRHWQSLAANSTKVNPNDKMNDNSRQSVAQFFNKITDQNFFAHLVKANETPTRSSISRSSTQSSPIQRSSVITFTGKSSCCSSPSPSIVSSIDQESQDVCDLKSNKSCDEISMKDDTLINSNYDPDCLPVYQNLVNKQNIGKQSRTSGSYVTLSPSSSPPSSLSTSTKIQPSFISPFNSSTPEKVPINKSINSQAPTVPSLSLKSSTITLSSTQTKTPELNPSKQSKSWATEEIDKKVDNFVKPTTSILPSSKSTPSSTSSSSASSSPLSSFLSPEPSKSVSLNVFHHIIDSYFTRINMKNERLTTTLALNSMEEARLIELTLAYGVFNEPFIYPITNFENLPVDCYNASVSSLISMTKKLSAYGELPIEDQIGLLRGTFADILAMRNTFIFDLEHSSWPIKGTKFAIEFTSLVHYDDSFYNDYLDFMKNLNPLWKCNVFINQLIVVIMLFNYNLPYLKSPEAIRLEYCAYIYLLQRYLESSLHLKDQTKEILCQILGKINHLQTINGNLVRLSVSNGRTLDEIKIGALDTLLTPD